jgi:DnaJ domain
MTPVPSDPGEERTRPLPEAEPAPDRPAPADHSLPPNGTTPAVQPSPFAPDGAGGGPFGGGGGSAPPSGRRPRAIDNSSADLSPAPDAHQPAARPGGVPDFGLYAVLGVSPAASDAEIQVAYRRKAAWLSHKYARGGRELRQLNAAYEVLGNPTRRAEYDRTLHTYSPPTAPRRAALQPPAPSPAALPVAPRHRTGRVLSARNGGLAELLAVVFVVALAVGAAWYLIPRVPVDLSALNALSSILSLSPAPRRIALDTPPTPAPTSQPTPTPAAPTPAPTAVPQGLADHFLGSTVTMSSSSPAQNTPVSVLIALKRDGQPASGLDLYAEVHYRTVQQRYPPSGTVKTGPDGKATITFDVGPATADYAVEVVVFTEVDGEQLSWTTSFTPH